jgi:hypothetical protein
VAATWWLATAFAIAKAAEKSKGYRLLLLPFPLLCSSRESSNTLVEREMRTGESFLDAAQSLFGGCCSGVDVVVAFVSHDDRREKRDREERGEGMSVYGVCMRTKR